LTPKGQALRPALSALTEWARLNMEETTEKV
jgi:DNA-binding HxlR family transcriptional regulator